MLAYHSVQNLVFQFAVQKFKDATPPLQTVLLISYKNLHTINIHNFDAVHVQAKNNIISVWVLFYLTTAAGHFSLLLHPTCWQSADWATVI
jgi:hypothetical protein